MDIIKKDTIEDETNSILRMIDKGRKDVLKSDKNMSQDDNISDKMHEKESLKETRLNEQLSEMLEKMSIVMKKKGDNIRSRIYSRALDTVLAEENDITDVNQMEGKPHIGPTILSKMNEYIKTGTLSIFESEKDNPLTWLTDIHGIGPKKAVELIEKGIRNIDELRERQDDLLNNVQKIGLKYYEDTIKRIPREEINEYNELFRKEFKKIADKDSQYEIVGSFRRGAKTSGDVDVIITSKNPDVFKQFVESLKATGIILEILSCGNTKCLVIAKLKGNAIARRVDFMYSPPDEYPFAVLYFTGSKAFNTVMRGHSLKMGISLNEHGFYEKEVGEKKGDKLDKNVKTEEDIFKVLNMKYKTPDERIDGRSVEFINKTIESQIIDKPNKPKRKYTKKKKVTEEIKPTTDKPKRKYTKKKKVTEEVKPIEEPIILEIEELPELVPIITASDLPKSKLKISSSKNITKRKKVLKNDNKKDKEMKKESKMDKEKVKTDMLAFKTQGFSVIENLSEYDLGNMITFANEQYYNTKKPIATDAEYDIIVEFMERKYPNNPVLEGVGAKVEKNKVTLPYEMASMDKIKPDTFALSKWKNKYNGPYLLSCKLDGVSGLYTTEGETAKLYTRGDGKVGQDVSHLLKVLKLPKEKGYVVRGEFIILKSTFDDKYKNTFANPRNLVSGIVNSKTIDEKSRDLHFIAYEVIKPELTPSGQMTKLEELGHRVVQNRLDTEISNETLSETLIDWRTNYDYEIDGVIVTNDKIHIRKTGNPEHAFAFKMVISDQVAEAKVLDVIWTPSKSGYLKPRVRIEPIRLGGVTIEYATGFNGNFIETNKIGIGAVIELVRSGDVIPHIRSVTTSAEKAKMPTVPYHWTETHVDIVLDDISMDETVQEKNITAFFTGIEVDGLSSGNVKRLMKAGYNTIPKIIDMNKTDFEKVEGFKEKMINKIHDGIRDKVAKASLIDIMAASNLFGRGIGIRKITPIMSKYPEILTSTESEEEKRKMLLSIPGIGTENAKSFVENITKFMVFIKEIKLTHKLTSELENTMTFENKDVKTYDTSHALYGKHIVMTKVRDKHIIESLDTIGGILDDNIGKNTDILITKSYDDVSNKVKKAKDMNIPIYTPADFAKKYDIQP